MLLLRRMIPLHNHVKKFERSLATKRDLIEPNLWIKIRRKMGLLDVSTSRLKYSSFNIYASCTDRIDHLNFFQKFSLADTFFSWFLITELHVWMTLVRAMQEGKEGREVRNYIVEHLWKDTEMRCKALGPIKPSIKRETLQLLNDQFQAAIFAYDEGLLANDRVLAGAIWRRFLQKKCDDPEKIENLISYIRRAMNHLDSLDRATFLLKGEISWPLAYEKQN